MLTTMIGLYPYLVQAQGRSPVETISDRQSERARQQATEQVLDRGDGAPVVDAQPVFQRADPIQMAQEDSAAGTSEAASPGRPTMMSTRLPDRLPIVDISGNQAFMEVEIAPDIRVVEHEWIMLVRTSQRDALEEQAPDLMEFLTGSQPFESIGSEILIFNVPTELDVNDAILELVPSDMRHLIDRNHIYSVEAEQESSTEAAEEEKGEAGEAEEGAESTSGDSVSEAMLTTPLNPVCEDTLGVGIIDSSIFMDHPAFAAMSERGTGIVTRDFIDSALEQPKGHGTAVAGLLAGQADDLSPLLPGATLYSAGVVYSRDTFHEGATVTNLLRALDWLMIQDVQVINMSLAGPPNRLLAQAIETTVTSGRFIVAAVGNEGPHAPAQYPAAYDFVISATAVTDERDIYRWANQGDYVDFSALGVSVPTTRGDGSIGKESGTSIAAPVVSAFLACALVKHRSASSALNSMKAHSVDLGMPGQDAVFGHGLLHP